MKPRLYLEYIGEELAIFWESPFGFGKEKIASFWWPFHSAEDTPKAEQIFESMAEWFVRSWNERQETDAPDIAARLRAAMDYVVWDRHPGEGDGPTLLEQTSAEVERILAERTADLCAEIYRLRGQL